MKLLLLSLLPPYVSPYTPFGYQMDSAHSWEYRTKIDNPSNDQLGLDPSSYAGAIHYDPLHHALYLTGATYGSGAGVFDGVDVYELTTTEQTELNDQDATNNGYWWMDMASGLRPHLLDVGIPDYSPKNGDCFYAVMGLPTESSDDIPVDPDSIINSTLDPNRVKLLHSRRFGSNGNTEACSALDVLFAKPNATGPGGYVHEFEVLMEDYNSDSVPSFTGTSPPFGSDGPPPPSSSPATQASVGAASGMPVSATTTSSASGMPTASIFIENEDIFGGTTPSPTTPPVIGTRRGLRSSQQGAVGEKEDEEMAMAGVHNQQVHHRSLQDTSTTIPIQGEGIQTRSVRLLMAGHVELPDDRTDGYIVSDLPVGQYNEASVYAFAQQVDVRLPVGKMEQSEVNQDMDSLLSEEYENLEYNLHEVGTEEDELAQELEEDYMSNIPQSDFEGIVTSGVESRALLNDGVTSTLRTIYPVSLVADSTTRKHYYVVMMASDNAGDNRPEYAYLNMDPTIADGAAQRAWTEYPETEIDVSTGDNFGTKSRPNYGSGFRIIVKKMWVEGNANPDDLSDAEKNLAATSYDSGGLVAMRHSWTQEFSPDSNEDARPSGLLFAPSGSEDGSGDMLIMVGTTAGRGSAFGTASEENVFEEGEVREDLDGFVTKIRADTGAFAGGIDFDATTNQFENTMSFRIQTNPGNNEIVAGVCAKPPLSGGMLQEEVSYIYVVGSTSGVLSGVSSDLRSEEFLSSIPVSDEIEVMEAFLMKVDVSTMKTVWTVQVGAITSDRDKKVNTHGFGCAVTRDGEGVYLTGLVKDGGVVTDFSEADQGGMDSNSAEGGTDIFISSYSTEDGSRIFLKQVGSDKDDFPSRGNGGITSDRAGNAIVTGSTRGSLMRKRRDGEYIYGSFKTDAAMDIFLMSFDREDGNHIPIGTGSVSEEYQETLQESEQESESDAEQETGTDSPVSEATDPTQATQTEKATNSALVGAVAFAMAFILLSVIAAVVVVRKIKAKKRRENDALTANGNLRRPSENLQSKRKSSAWKANRDTTQMKEFTNDLNMAVEVRNSASGGWHGTYGEEQLQSIDFGTPSGEKDDVVQQSLFMDDALEEIEESSSKYVIGEMDDVSDEDLIKAYNDAMAVEIEPENPDVEFAMQGVGSIPVLDKDDHNFT